MTPMEPVQIEVREDGRIGVTSGYRDKENIDQVPGHRWDQERRQHHLPLSWAAMQQMRGVFGDRLEVGPKLQELAWQVYEQRVKPCMELREARKLSADHPVEVALRKFGI